MFRIIAKVDEKGWGHSLPIFYVNGEVDGKPDEGQALLEAVSVMDPWVQGFDVQLEASEV